MPYPPHAKRLVALFLFMSTLHLAACGNETDERPAETAVHDASTIFDPYLSRLPTCEQLPDYMSAGEPSLIEEPCDYYPPPPPPPPPPPVIVRPISQLYAKAQYLGISPMVAGVPNIETSSQSRPIVFRPQDYPAGSTSTQNFIDRLFLDGQWQNPPLGPVVVTPQTGAPNCTLNRVTAIAKPELFIATNAGSGYLFPGAINQGRYINMGVGSLMPIHVPYTKRNPVRLSTDFFTSAISPTSTLSDVNSTIGQLLQNAPAQAPANAFFDSTTANTLVEAASAFKMDVKMLGVEASSKFETDVSTRKNTVYAFFIQQLFTVNVDLQGYKPIQGLFNSSFTVSDLENLGNSNELGFDNLPTYVDSVTFGRILIFSVTSTASSVELKQAVDLKYDGNGGSLSNRLKYIIDNSEIRVFSYGGPFEPTAQAIRDGSYLSYFNSTNVPRNLAKPIGYTTRLWNDDPGPMYRTTEYTTRNCAPIHDITVRLSEVYDNASLYVSPMGTGSEVYVGTTDEDATWDITNRLTDSTDILRIANQGNRKGFPPNWQRAVRLEVRVDGELMINDKRDCKWCNSTSEAFKVKANRVTGHVELM